MGKIASTYTDNSGIELIGVGEQSGTWGTTTNNNLEIVDKALNGVTDITVSGDMNTVDDGDKTSNGHARVLKLTGLSSATLITDASREAFTYSTQCNWATSKHKTKNSGTTQELADASTNIPNLVKVLSMQMVKVQVVQV